MFCELRGLVNQVIWFIEGKVVFVLRKGTWAGKSDYSTIYSYMHTKTWHSIARN